MEATGRPSCPEKGVFESLRIHRQPVYKAVQTPGNQKRYLCKGRLSRHPAPRAPMQGTWVSQRIRFGGDGMNASVRAPRWVSALAGLLLAGTAAATPPLSLGSYQHTAFQKQE